MDIISFEFFVFFVTVLCGGYVAARYVLPLIFSSFDIRTYLFTKRLCLYGLLGVCGSSVLVMPLHVFREGWTGEWGGVVKLMEGYAGDWLRAYLLSLFVCVVGIFLFTSIIAVFLKMTTRNGKAGLRFIPFTQIRITVRDMAAAEPFYDSLMPILGYDLRKKTSSVIEEHDLHVVEYPHSKGGFAICSPRQAFKDDAVHWREPGAMHNLALRAENRAHVDWLYREIAAIGASIVHTPRVFSEHGKNYYAFFFKDPDGIKYEIVCDKAE